MNKKQHRKSKIYVLAYIKPPKIPPTSNEAIHKYVNMITHISGAIFNKPNEFQSHSIELDRMFQVQKKMVSLENLDEVLNFFTSKNYLENITFDPERFFSTRACKNTTITALRTTLYRHISDGSWLKCKHIENFIFVYICASLKTTDTIDVIHVFCCNATAGV